MNYSELLQLAKGWSNFKFTALLFGAYLLNPIYVGKIRFNVQQDWNSKRRKGTDPNPIVVDGLHEAIIDEETWQRNMLIMKTKGNKSVRTHDGFYPLTGILK